MAQCSCGGSNDNCYKCFGTGSVPGPLTPLPTVLETTSTPTTKTRSPRKLPARKSPFAPTPTGARAVWHAPEMADLEPGNVCRCDKCGAIVLESDLSGHQRSFHQDARPVHRYWLTQSEKAVNVDVLLDNLASQRSHRRNSNRASSSAGKVGSGKSLSCPYCGKACGTDKLLAKHSLKCSWFPSEVSIRAALQRLGSLHRKKMSIPANMCAICGLEFARKELVKPHINLHWTSSLRT